MLWSCHGKTNKVLLMLWSLCFRNACTKSGPLRFSSFPVVDWFCLFIDLWVLNFPLEDCSVLGNFVITLIYVKTKKVLPMLWSCNDKTKWPYVVVMSWQNKQRAPYVVVMPWHNKVLPLLWSCHDKTKKVILILWSCHGKTNKVLPMLWSCHGTTKCSPHSTLQPCHGKTNKVLLRCGQIMAKQSAPHVDVISWQNKVLPMLWSCHGKT